MFTVSVIGQKGGTGKTTAIVGLAVAAIRAGYKAAVIDLDPQASVANWKDRRTDEQPAVVSAQATRLRQTVEAASAGGVDFLFIDTAGRNDDSALSAARMSNLVLVPSRPNIVEVETLPKVSDLLKVAGSPRACVLLNGIHPSAGRASVEEVRTGLKELFGMEVCPVHLCQRNAYAEAMTTGKVPQELETDGKAADELSRLFVFIDSMRKEGQGNGRKVQRTTATA